MHASARLDHSLLAVDTEHDVHAMLELASPELGGHGRAPLRLVLVVDRSGSMAGPKLEVAKRCAAWLAGRLRPDDELALVDYDDAVRLLVPLRAVEATQFRGVIERIQAGGSTNLSGGWLKGLEELRGAPDGSPRTILLLTDGLANMGVTDPRRLAGLAGEARAKGIGTATIGLGEAFDEELLTAMADAGGGNAHYAATPDDAPGIFARELEGLTRLAAQNVSVEIRPAAEVEVVSILNDYPATPVAGGLQLQLGDAYAGDERRIVVAFHVPELARLGPASIAELVVRYVSVGEELEAHTVTIPVAANLVSADEAAAADPDLAVREEVLVLEAAQTRREAIRLADRGEHQAAHDLVRNTAARLRESGGPNALAQADVLDEELPLLDAEAYAAANRKTLRYSANQIQRRRRNT